jgi:hypothetical protein
MRLMRSISNTPRAEHSRHGHPTSCFRRHDSQNDRLWNLSSSKAADARSSRSYGPFRFPGGSTQAYPNPSVAFCDGCGGSNCHREPKVGFVRSFVIAGPSAICRQSTPEARSWRCECAPSIHQCPCANRPALHPASASRDRWRCCRETSSRPRSRQLLRTPH